MEEMMWIVILVIGAVATGKIIYMIHRNQSENNTAAAGGNERIVPAGNNNTINRNASETGPMVYYANDNHGRRDREYRFNYKKVNGSWRAYILRMPSLGGRDSSGTVTHRLYDGTKPYVCWDSRVNSLKDMQTISRVWADSIQEYIATGKRFG